MNHREPVEFIEASKPQFGEKKKIKLFQGGNGDFYLTVCPHNHNGGDTIRIETSGGASTRNPRLVQAINLLYLAMAEDNEAFDSILKSKIKEPECKQIESIGYYILVSNLWQKTTKEAYEAMSLPKVKINMEYFDESWELLHGGMSRDEAIQEVEKFLEYL